MKSNILTILIITFAISSFTACSSKNENEEYNKPAVYWYNKMLKQLSINQIDNADDTFTSLESEHRKSPYIKSSMMIMANAHMDDEEYAMANYYLDEYQKKFGSVENIDYIRFLKIKSNFLAFKNQYREQNLITQTLMQTEKFINDYPKSQYLYLVKDVKSRLLMAKSKFDMEISKLYERLDKPKAQKFYENKTKQNWKNPENIEDIDVPWYRYIFE